MKVKKVWHRINKLMRAQESQAEGKVEDESSTSTGQRPGDRAD